MASTGCMRTIRDGWRGEPIDIYIVGYLISLLVIAFSDAFHNGGRADLDLSWHLLLLSLWRNISASEVYLISTGSPGLSCLQLVLFEVTLYTYW